MAVGSAGVGAMLQGIAPEDQPGGPDAVRSDSEQQQESPEGEGGGEQSATRFMLLWFGAPLLLIILAFAFRTHCGGTP